MRVVIFENYKLCVVEIVAGKFFTENIHLQNSFLRSSVVSDWKPFQRGIRWLLALTEACIRETYLAPWISRVQTWTQTSKTKHSNLYEYSVYLYVCVCYLRKYFPPSIHLDSFNLLLYFKLNLLIPSADDQLPDFPFPFKIKAFICVSCESFQLSALNPAIKTYVF